MRISFRHSKAANNRLMLRSKQRLFNRKERKRSSLPKKKKTDIQKQILHSSCSNQHKLRLYVCPLDKRLECSCVGGVGTLVF